MSQKAEIGSAVGKKPQQNHNKFSELKTANKPKCARPLRFLVNLAVASNWASFGLGGRLGRCLQPKIVIIACLAPFCPSKFRFDGVVGAHRGQPLTGIFGSEFADRPPLYPAATEQDAAFLGVSPSTRFMGWI